jgi:hypothetical protein
MSLFNQTLILNSTKVGAPCLEAKKMFLAHLLRILLLDFKHVPCGKILFDNISIFYTTNIIFKYFATSFVVIVIVAFVWETN